MSTLRMARQDNTSLTAGDMAEGSHEPGVTVVIPCLNECITIAEAVVQAKAAFANWLWGVEVVVADNSSTDGSAELARAMGRPSRRVLPPHGRPTACMPEELLVNALRAGAKIVEGPITIRCDRRNRQPHLQTWRDGMRHLLTILARAPWLFLHSGLAIVVLSLLIATMCAFGPRLVFGRFAVFDYHTLIFVCSWASWVHRFSGRVCSYSSGDRDCSQGLRQNSSTCMKGYSSGSSPALPRALSAVLASLPGVGRGMALPTLPI
jgi:hypothetical protein